MHHKDARVDQRGLAVSELAHAKQLLSTGAYKDKFTRS